ncbi:uncharacterized protein LOC103941883 isoform X2 [Pyrus x bretschneideri]|uniref:uncharacterized protein LOC103941883 isoform X2 n=1 Tax=Pyrus x bretschneideri TaxID=225117 RepID=UPI00202DCD60|nr:uncharacterized protein LOC103941883 isoform X2 [Pyrus x bretschneideri]
MAAAASSPSSSPVRWWRTAFLTVRDETLTTPLRTPIPELPRARPPSSGSHLRFALRHGARHREASRRRRPYSDLHSHNSLASWTLLIDFFNKMLRYFIGSSSFTPVMEALQTLGRVMSTYQRKCSMAEEVLLVKFLLRIIESSHAELSSFLNLILNQSSVLEVGKRMPVPRYGSLWEIQTLAFTMVGEAISRVGSSFPLDIWRSTIEVFRKVMDGLVAKSQLMEDAFMSRFNLSLLHCLHLTLADCKCYLSDHASSFVAALQMFFSYGINSRPQHTCSVIGQKEKEPSLASLKLGLEDSKETNSTPYRPPHLRQRDNSNMKQSEAWGSQSLSDHESSANEFALSDSDYSDSDGSIKDNDNIQKSKVRVAAIVCIQIFKNAWRVVTVFTSLQERMKNGFTFKSDHTGLLILLRLQRSQVFSRYFDFQKKLATQRYALRLFRRLGLCPTITQA